MYIIISPHNVPKKSPFLAKVFSEYFLRQTTNRHTILCGSVEVWKISLILFLHKKEQADRKKDQAIYESRGKKDQAGEESGEKGAGYV